MVWNFQIHKKNKSTLKWNVTLLYEGFTIQYVSKLRNISITNKNTNTQQITIYVDKEQIYKIYKYTITIWQSGLVG